ncbi:unnamed protein product [Macrosiphum euphorbiae]|uniref:Uncharacterized protein n=1 Tax=Macrosiphum euphorbiae TaxID=13131 RepID=A0AAV0XJ17_9HEMI|nr:unnamed protein product [Macrosiphum euphorbiae]
MVGTLKSTRISWAEHIWRSAGLIGQITGLTQTKTGSQAKGRSEDIIGVRNTQEISNDREEWRQYVVAEMGLKGL